MTDGSRTIRDSLGAATAAERWARRLPVTAGVVILLVLMVVQLALTARWHSMTVDEGNHIYSGYMSWKEFDFGLNPEHPPLVKLLAALPLLDMRLQAPTPAGRYFKVDAYVGGRQFLLGNDQDAILFRARMAVALLAVVLAFVVFATAREMFGLGADFLALVLAVFDPNLLGHGALVTTDTAASCFLLASVYAFYRYVRRPSALRLAVTGLAAGLALGVKHNGMFVFPILGLLALYEVVRSLTVDREAGSRVWTRPVRLVAGLVATAAVSVVVLWAAYGFRYDARPAGTPLRPPMAAMLQRLEPAEANVVSTLARWKLLPESYLFGAADVRAVGEHYPSYILGAMYRHGVWFYFPIVLTIKSTEAMLALAVATLGALVFRRFWARREFVYLALPAAVCLAIAMSAHLNTGVRHILPVYAFLWPMLAAGAATLLRGRWTWVLVAAAVLHAGSSLATFHRHIPYANLFWGGPDNVHRLLTDSNADWGQQLRRVKQYLDGRKVTDCWFAYIGEGETRMAAWGIPCKPLPNLDALMFSSWEVVPETIDGSVLISADELSGYLTGPGPLNPFGDFQKLRPSANLDGGVLVYEGRFAVPRLSALTRRLNIGEILSSDPQAAVIEAREIVALDPENADSWITLGRALTAAGQNAEARAAFERAIRVAQTVEPEFQAAKIPRIEALMAPAS